MAETAVLNLLYQGRIETLSPVKRFFKGEVTVIRPLVYVPEREIMRYARTAGYTVSECRCPLGVDSRRARIKEVLMSLRKENPRVITNVNKAYERYVTEMEGC